MLFNPINDKLFSRHSNWSRYQSQKVKTDPETWNYEIKPAYFPSYPSDTIRVLSMNLERYPKTYYSPVVVASVILSTQARLVYIQELTRTNAIPELCNFLNNYLDSDAYDFIYGIDTIRNLQIAILYNKDYCSLLSFKDIFLDYSASKQAFSRPVLSGVFDFDFFILRAYALHLPSHSKIGGSDMIINCFEELGNFFDSVSKDILYVLGGDWNTTSTSSLFGTHLPDFTSVFASYSNNSDMLLNNSNALTNIIKDPPVQVVWNTTTYNQITNRNWNLYVSDHFPIVCDYEIL